MQTSSMHIQNVNSSTGSPLKYKFFAGLEDTALEQILRLAKVSHVGPKTNVVFSGEQSKKLYLLRSGKARSYVVTDSGSEILLLWVVPGDVIGLVSLLPNAPNYFANATTISECEFLVWDHNAIRTLAKAYPHLTENGFRMALHYLGIFMRRHADILSKNAESRLARALLHLASRVGEVQSSGVAIEVTNEQLSSLSDISSFTASRLLSKWQRQGALGKERGRVTLLAPEALMVA